MAQNLDLAAVTFLLNFCNLEFHLFVTFIAPYLSCILLFSHLDYLTDRLKTLQGKIISEALMPGTEPASSILGLADVGEQIRASTTPFGTEQSTYRKNFTKIM